MSQEDEKADVVDFDALHAALGDIPPPPNSSTPVLGEASSSGKNNATYASARPHTIPPTRAPVVDMNAPSIVVAQDDGQPTSHPNMLAAQNQMTIPMGSPILSGVGAVSPGPMPVAGGRPPSPSRPGYDVPRFPANEGVQQTMHMAGRPIALPRRPRAMTMVVHPRGPSSKQKVFVFLAMLFLVVAMGLGIFALVRPGGIGIDGFPGMKPVPPAPAPVPAPLPTLRKATTVVAPAPTVTAPAVPATTTAAPPDTAIPPTE